MDFVVLCVEVTCRIVVVARRWAQDRGQIGDDSRGACQHLRLVILVGASAPIAQG